MDSSSDEEIEYEPKDFLLCGENFCITTVALMPLSVLVKLGGVNEVSGQKLWCGSVCLSEFFALSDFSQIVGTEVIELGAGTGAAGMLCSRRGASMVWLTDHDTKCINHMTTDCAVNEILNTEVVRFDWLQPTLDAFHTKGGGGGLGTTSSNLTLIAGDVLYKAFLVEPFFRSVALLMSSTHRDSVLYLCHIPRAGVEHDIVVAGAVAQGLDVTRCSDDFKDRVNSDLCPVEDTNRAHCYEIRMKDTATATAVSLDPATPSEGRCGFGRISIAAVTPFFTASESDTAGTTQQAIDTQCFSDSISFLAAGMAAARGRLSISSQGDIGGIIVPGTTGEQHSLSVDEKKYLFELAVAAAEPYDMSIFAGVAATTTFDAVQLAKHAVLSGCSGIMLGLPPYIKPNDAELTTYVEAVYNVIPASCPILLYNNVNRNGAGASFEALVAWYRRGLICGIKHANAPVDVFLEDSRTLLSMEPTIRLYTGSDAMSKAVLLPNASTSADGSQTFPPTFYGLTSIIGNLYPEEISLMITGLVAADDRTTSTTHVGEAHPLSLTEAVGLHADLSTVASACLVNASLPVGLKYALRKESNGRLGGWSRLPLSSITGEQMTLVDGAMSTFNDKKQKRSHA